MAVSGYSLTEQIQGFPIFQFLVVAWVLLAQQITEQSTDCYLWHILKSFPTGKGHDEVITHIGYLAAATHLPRIASYILWSKYSDRIGRKFVLIIGSVGLAVAMLMYGFGRQLWIVILSKIVLSFLNANDAIIRTILGELSFGFDAQKVPMFLIFPISYGIGYIFGPLIGENLITPWTGPPPEDQVPTFRTIFPFAKPNIVLASLLLSSALFTFLFLEETNLNDLSSNVDIGLLIGDRIRSKLYLGERHASNSATKYDHLDQDDSLVNNNIDNIELDADISTIADEEGGLFKNVRQNVFHNILGYILLYIQIIFYGAMADSFITSGLKKDEIAFPFKLVGGLGFSWGDTPAIYSSCNYISLFLLAGSTMLLVKKLGLVKSYRYSLVLLISIYFIVPEIAFFMPDYSGLPKFFSNCLLYFITIVQKYASGVAFTVILVLVDMSFTSENRASMNGYILSISSAINFFDPLISKNISTAMDLVSCGVLFWWLFALFAIFSFIQSRFLKD